MKFFIIKTSPPITLYYNVIGGFAFSYTLFSFNLLSLYTEQKINQPAEPSWDDVKKDYSNLKNEINTNKTETGCGCFMMIFIVLIIYWLLS